MKLQVLDISTITFDKKLYNSTACCENKPFWFFFVAPHVEEIGVKVTFGPIGQIDKSKKWFISLAPQLWHWNDYYDDIISSLPDEVQDGLINGNAYLILNHECESFTEHFYMHLYQKLQNSKLPPNKIIYMVGAADAEREYQNYIKNNNLQPDRQISIMASFHVYKMLDKNLNSFEYNLATKKEKKFLSLNRVARNHRLMLVSLMAHHNLIDHGFVSLGINKEDLPLAITKLKIDVPDANPNVFLGLEKIVDKLPLQVDKVDLSINQFATTSLPTEFYEKSCFSVISSTFALKKEEPSVGFTEKEIKVILYKHPFIIYNLTGVLKHLKAMGFLTFGKWIDETYDDEVNDIKRLDMIVKEIKRLSEISFDEWSIMLNEMQPIFLHNYNRLVKYNTEHCFFNSDLKNFLYYVT